MREIPLLLWFTVALTVAGIVFAMEKWAGNVNSGRKSLHEFMKRIEGKIEKINDKLEKIFHFLSTAPLEKRTGPISLTDYGRKLSREIRASEISDMELATAFGQVKGLNAYQVQEYCFEFVKTSCLTS